MAADKVKSDKREERLRAQLRANLARRKQQARARREGDGDGRDEGISAANAAEPKSDSVDD